MGEGIGMMNMATLQGTDNSIQSGIMAADTLINNWERIEKGDGLDRAFINVMKESGVNRELYKSRSTRGMFEKGLFAGMAYSVSYFRKPNEFLLSKINYCIFTLMLMLVF